MNEDELRQCLARAYERGEGQDWYAIDIDLLKREPEYVHVMVIVDNRLRRPPLWPRPL